MLNVHAVRPRDDDFALLDAVIEESPRFGGPVEYAAFRRTVDPVHSGDTRILHEGSVDENGGGGGDPLAHRGLSGAEVAVGCDACAGSVADSVGLTVVTLPSADPARFARRCHNAHHPVHIAYYFAPEHDAMYSALGLDPGPMSYVAGRAAPLGTVSEGTVVATFYNINPELVARMIPRIWATTSPAALLRTRSLIVDAYLTRLLGREVIASKEMSEAADLALRAVRACTAPGRPLYAANAGLPVPEPPHLAFWHAITLLREHRGDGHLMALATAGLGGVDALVTHSASGTGFTPAYLQMARGWSAQEWAQARVRLCDRGLLDAAGELTALGMQTRRDIEVATDRLDVAPYEHLGLAGTKRLIGLAGEFTKLIQARNGFPLRDMGKG